MTTIRTTKHHTQSGVSLAVVVVVLVAKETKQLAYAAREQRPQAAASGSQNTRRPRNGSALISGDLLRNNSGPLLILTSAQRKAKLLGLAVLSDLD